LDDACVEALKILKQVMEEKLTSTNIEVRHGVATNTQKYLVFKQKYQIETSANFADVCHLP